MGKQTDNEFIDDSAPIKNCEFTYKCPKRWGALIKTDRENIRYCTECDRGVYFCNTQKELADAVRDKRCAAMIITDDDNETFEMMGDVLPPSFFGDAE